MCIRDRYMGKQKIVFKTMTNLITSEKKIGILGGMFNPPTNAHMQMAIEAINLGFVHEVWFVPSGNDPLNQTQPTAETRFQMVKMAVKDFFNEEFPIKVNDLEVKKGVQIPTYNLMKQLIDNKQENQQFCFMMGEDNLKNLQEWDNSEELCKEIPFLIFKRKDSVLDQNLVPDICFIIETTFIAASSTEIRQRIKRNLNVQKLFFVCFYEFGFCFVLKDQFH
eukprot:TRINITY_DN3090_c0_g1_i1.p2 TRINITY_DN3090_c0_g1~~TRINITY_DN3090_c0_g1_i1.p2  ORF type:complete len:222 (-),score=38.17 TRINITY_DN3090_c0_g1_i1:228-893(-)